MNRAELVDELLHLAEQGERIAAARVVRRACGMSPTEAREFVGSLRKQY
jgi:hypothetical protein